MSVNILVVADDKEVRSAVVSVINNGLLQAGFTDVNTNPTGEEDILHSPENIPSALDAIRAINPQAFDEPVHINYGDLGLVPADAIMQDDVPAEATSGEF